MSNMWASTYDYAVVPTLSDTVNDPAGPFAGVLITATPGPGGGGTIAIWPNSGPMNPVNLPIVIQVNAGVTLNFPIARIGLTGTSVTCLGLCSAIVRQGGFNK